MAHETLDNCCHHFANLLFSADLSGKCKNV